MSKISPARPAAIGVGKVAHSPADGYTLCVGTLTTNVLIGGLYKLDFDVLNDLTPIAELAYEPLLICVKNSLPVHNLKELIAWLKANPGKASVGIPGVGSTGNLAGLSFQKATGTTFQFVPYRGDGPAVQDMMAGQIDMMIEPSSNFTAQVKAGTIRAIAVPSKTRMTSLPEVPTTDEAGLPGFYASIWFGMWAPKGTPQDVLDKIHAATVAALKNDSVKDKLNSARPADLLARSAIGRGIRRLSEGGGRQMVADHERGRHQDAMSSPGRRPVQLA